MQRSMKSTVTKFTSVAVHKNLPPSRDEQKHTRPIKDSFHRVRRALWENFEQAKDKWSLQFERQREQSHPVFQDNPNHWLTFNQLCLIEQLGSLKLKAIRYQTYKSLLSAGLSRIAADRLRMEFSFEEKVTLGDLRSPLLQFVSILCCLM